MKRYTNQLIALLATIILLSGCTHESLIGDEEKVIEGIPTTVNLAFAAQEATQISSRAALDDKSEYQVNDLYVFVFRKSGTSWEKELGKQYKGTDLTIDGEKKGSLKINITSGSKRIYAIANVGEGDNYVSLEHLAEVKTIEQMNSLVASGIATVDRTQARQLMSGALNEKALKEKGKVTVNTDGSIKEGGNILLRHLDSSVTFNVKAGEGITFIPKEWKVYRAPNKSFLFQQDQDAMKESSDSDYFNMKNYANFEKVDGVGDDSKGGSFIFYMLENRKWSKEDNLESYQQREQEVKNADGSNQDVNDYLNVSNDAAYVELKGYYKTKNDKGQMQTANVRYIIHMGFVNPSPDPDDFSHERNGKYTYNVTITGVESIIVEAKNENPDPDNPYKNENQSGAEGDVVTSTDHKLLDAHYDVQLVKFNAKELLHMSFMANVPVIGTCQYNASNDDENSFINTTDARLYNWITFVRNEKPKRGEYSTDFKLFPNDQNADKRLTILQVLKELEHEKGEYDKGNSSLFDSKGNMVYTAYIDEYYYNDNDISWRDCVNKENREMNILCKTDVSADKSSSFTSTSIMFSQRSIKTFYSLNAPSAWGIETIRENEIYAIGGYNGEAKDPDNGRYNNYRNINYSNDSQWSEYLDLSQNVLRDVKGARYKKMAYACMNKNRDLDGNGRITHNEIRWYLPAINQYVGVWMGKDGLPSEAHLVKNGGVTITNDNKKEFHFRSSDNIQFWAEEGAATGYDQEKPDEFDYRCVRNLGMEDTGEPSINSKPDHYVTKTGNEFNLIYMNERSLREGAVTSEELSPHDELSPINRPYKKFQMASTPIEVRDSSRFWKGAAEANKCKGYNEGNHNWRMPNQREISLMISYSKDMRDNFNGAYYAWAITSSSLSYKKKESLGYGVTSEPSIAIPTNGSSNNATKNLVWCVRDVK